MWVLENGTQTTRVVTRSVDWEVWTRDGSAVLYSHNGAIYALTIADKTTKRLSRRGANVFPLLSFVVAG